MSTSGKIYISRGFSGAMTFAVNKDTNTVRFDYLPRIITTSGIVKTLNGQYSPTIMARQRSAATTYEQQDNANYNNFIYNTVQKRYHIS